MESVELEPIRSVWLYAPPDSDQYGRIPAVAYGFGPLRGSAVSSARRCPLAAFAPLASVPAGACRFPPIPVVLLAVSPACHPNPLSLLFDLSLPSVGTLYPLDTLVSSAPPLSPRSPMPSPPPPDIPLPFVFWPLPLFDSRVFRPPGVRCVLRSYLASLPAVLGGPALARRPLPNLPSHARPRPRRGAGITHRPALCAATYLSIPSGRTPSAFMFRAFWVTHQPVLYQVTGLVATHHYIDGALVLGPHFAVLCAHREHFLCFTVMFFFLGFTRVESCRPFLSAFLFTPPRVSSLHIVAASAPPAHVMSAFWATSVLQLTTISGSRVLFGL
ncbi:unnamed protein product [Pleuronectes platessa]|uniref:Uncharacterized protein n=1 Tax=Pleuronectes platessa TaxID=8262 RepID=A0A9N7VXB4_PLEPL|nr:unnamed protein product [Pleuronectes platessa]